MVERSAFPWPYGDGRKTPETLAQEAALGRLRLDPLLTRWPEPHWRSFASALLRTGGDVDAACHAAGIRPDGMGRYAVLLKFSLDLDFQAECDRIHRLNQIPPTTVGLMAYALGLGCTFEEVAEDVGLPVEDVMGRVGCRRQDDRLPAHFPRVGPILQAEKDQKIARRRNVAEMRQVRAWLRDLECLQEALGWWLLGLPPRLPMIRHRRGDGGRAKCGWYYSPVNAPDAAPCRHCKFAAVREAKPQSTEGMSVAAW